MRRIPYKLYLPYIFVLVLFGVGIYGILQAGSHLTPASPLMPPSMPTDTVLDPDPAVEGYGVLGSALIDLLNDLRHPLGLLLLQIVVVIIAARGSGNLFRRMGQPAVIGEMAAGILLGPSFLGLLWPGTQFYLFPPESLNTLQLFAQVGVILFMFLVGTELDLRHIREKSHAAVLISHVSILVPFFLGVLSALLIYPQTAVGETPFGAFALFMGIAMSITAFPVLARILQEKGLSRTALGSMIITCAAVDDVTAWCLLAVVVTIASAGHFSGAILTIGLAILFLGAMIFLVRPQLSRLFGQSSGDDPLRGAAMAGLLVFALASALFTEAIGIHALFGAFLAGVVLPASPALRTFLRDRMETFTAVLLLPLFFAFTGLRTQLGLLTDWQSWLLCLGIVAVATTGKLGGSTLAARWTGMNWRDSFVVGACMNTRGLIELVVLNIGYDLGILSPRIFTIMVIMALTTTFMTGPLLQMALSQRGQHAPSTVTPY